MKRPDGKCWICGEVHEFKCAQIKAFEYYEDGSVKRTEFVTFADFAQPALLNMPTHGTRQ